MNHAVILASHGPLSSALLASAEMILGTTHIPAYTCELKVGQNVTDLINQVTEIINNNPETSFVICCDLFGASIATTCAPLSRLSNVVVVTGMNLALVLSLLIDEPGDFSASYIQNCVVEAADGIRIVELESDQEEDF